MQHNELLFKNIYNVTAAVFFFYFGEPKDLTFLTL